MPETAPARVFEILLVEDNAADARMIAEALKVLGVPHRLHVVENSERALQFLGRSGDYPGAPSPDLVLLDLALPGINGYDLLAEIRLSYSKQRLPVVVITGSRLHKDIERSFNLHADEFITKPVGLMHYTAELAFALRVLRSPRVAY